MVIIWNQYGRGENSFNGTINGQGYTIRNIHGTSLFGHIGKDAKISDLRVETIGNSDIILNDNMLGSFAFINDGKIDNINLKGDFFFTAKVINNQDIYIGGIVGHNNGTMINCNCEEESRFDYTITGTNLYFGYIAGLNEGVISNCRVGGSYNISSDSNITGNRYTGESVGHNLGTCD